MNRTELNRRDFHRLSAAALGGVVTGSLIGCTGQQGADEAAGTIPADGAVGTGGASATDTAAGDAGHQVALLMEEPHVCRGLNSCKGTGSSKDNACAGQGSCASAEHHACHAANKCKGQGGCGEHPGQNSCEGKGECSVPLMDGAWEKARAAFEQAMQAASKDIGAAPPKG